jgi:hypothetical protein
MAVTEVPLAENSVDAGMHSAGGILNVSISGHQRDTWRWLLFRPQPALNAAQNAITHAPNQVKNHIYGGTIGHPSRKTTTTSLHSSGGTNMSPAANVPILPTALEKQGDFSQSLNANGGLRTILIRSLRGSMSPPDKSLMTRSPGNIIPTNRIDPTSPVQRRFGR